MQCSCSVHAVYDCTYTAKTAACSVRYTAWAVYTPGTLLELQWTCSVHCTTLQVHSTSVWEVIVPITVQRDRMYTGRSQFSVFPPPSNSFFHFQKSKRKSRSTTPRNKSDIAAGQLATPRMRDGGHTPQPPSSRGSTLSQLSSRPHSRQTPSRSQSSQSRPHSGLSRPQSGQRPPSGQRGGENVEILVEGVTTIRLEREASARPPPEPETESETDDSSEDYDTDLEPSDEVNRE